MGILALRADERVSDLEVSAEALTVHLMDGRTIIVPLAWYPRLFNASPKQRKNWRIAGGGYGIHWPDLDEDLSTEGLLRGAPASQAGSSLLQSRRPQRTERTRPDGGIQKANKSKSIRRSH